MTMTKTLETNLLRLKNGESDALNDIFEETYEYVYTQARTIESNNQIISQLVKEVYIGVYNSIQNLNDVNQIYSWITGITYRLSEKHRDAAHLPDKNNINKISDIINALPGKYRALLYSFYYQKMSVGEIAADFGMTEKDIETIQSDAINTFKKLISEYKMSSEVTEADMTNSSDATLEMVLSQWKDEILFSNSEKEKIKEQVLNEIASKSCTVKKEVVEPKKEHRLMGFWGFVVSHRIIVSIVACVFSLLLLVCGVMLGMGAATVKNYGKELLNKNKDIQIRVSEMTADKQIAKTLDGNSQTSAMKNDNTNSSKDTSKKSEETIIEAATDETTTGAATDESTPVRPDYINPQHSANETTSTSEEITEDLSETETDVYENESSGPESETDTDAEGITSENDALTDDSNEITENEFDSNTTDYEHQTSDEETTPYVEEEYMETTK